MKNIHVLATDKPSRLYCYKSIELYLHPTIVDANVSNLDCKNYNIYITSDEEIKEGDWVLNSGDYDEDIVFKADESFFGTGLEAKKIILTTDQDLIKDGVQAIDDEFLNWFVKNPSCEEVDIKKIYLSNKGEWKDVLLPSEWEVDTKINYKIIIPKEESKQETFVNEKCFKCGRSQYSSRKPFCLDDFCNKDFYQKPKQETLEEVAPMVELVVFLDRIKKNLTNKTEVLTIQLIIDTIKSEFVDKELKWQQERMYSEEDRRLAI